MPSQYKIVKKSEKTRGNRFIEKEFKYYKKEGMISRDDVKKIVDGLEKKAEDNDIDIKIMVRGLTPYRWTTLKALDSGIYDNDDYYENQDVSFDTFFQLQLTVIQKI